MLDIQTRAQIIEIDSRIAELQNKKERILQSYELTTKEHYEFYHG